MSLKEQILKDLSASMKKRDKDRVKVLRFLQSSVKNKEIELRPESLTDSHVVAVLKKQIKQGKESLEHYKKADYKKQASEEEFQLSVLESYLPKALSLEELTQIVNQVILEIKAQSLKDMGPVMKAALDKAKGFADGKVLSQIVREKLSKL